MSKWQAKKSAMCPYYIAERELTLKCESLDGACECNLIFRNNDLMTAYLETHCNAWAFEKCPYYKAHIRKYEERERAKKKK